MAKYVGKKKDTLRKLAKRYGVTRKSIREMNPDMKFGKAKDNGGKGFKRLGGEEIRLGKGIGPGSMRARLLQDPKYAAFLRKFDYDRDKIRSDFIDEYGKDGQQSIDLARMEPIWNRQLSDTQRNTDRASDAQGMYRSGQRLLERGRNSSLANQQRQGYIDRQGDERTNAIQAKREALSGMKRTKMEEKKSTRERLTMRDATTKYGY